MGLSGNTHSLHDSSERPYYHKTAPAEYKKWIKYEYQDSFYYYIGGDNKYVA
ncbi:MAG: hypothetical protein SCALA701_37030 [Candidatus Scalindua sp.]|nr:MAG: hypothetical protein SCALA701_37030 [Candidatus Scalindua sp.]